MEVTSYKVTFAGGQQGVDSCRAYIKLQNGNSTVGLVMFHEPGMAFAADNDAGGIIKINLPSAMFQSVVDILRNEKPIFAFFAQGVGTLGTNVESVGEGEQ